MKEFPQLQFITFASQIFWLAITFGIMYFIMARKALPTVREVLQNRQTRIEEDLKKAEKLKEEAESAEADFTTVIVEAKERANALIGEVRQKAADDSEKRHAVLDEKFARQAQESELRIDKIKKEAIEEMIPVSIGISQDIVKKLINVDLNEDEVRKVLTSSNNT